MIENENDKSCPLGTGFKPQRIFLMDPQQALKEAVEEERYEDAAVLRDGGIPEPMLKQMEKYPNSIIQLYNDANSAQK